MVLTCEGYINVHNSVQIYSCYTKIHVSVHIYTGTPRYTTARHETILALLCRQSHGRFSLIYHLQPPCPPVSGLLNTFLKQNIKIFRTVRQSSVQASLYW